MRRQVLLAFVVVGVSAPIFLVVKETDGTLRPIWDKESPAQVEAPAREAKSEEDMADILHVDVADADDSSYNGRYYPAGTYTGKTYYAKVGTAKYLFWGTLAHPADHAWKLGPSLGAAQYEGSGEDLPANPWICVGGTEPAPTLSATEDDGGGHGDDTGSG